MRNASLPLKGGRRKRGSQPGSLRDSYLVDPANSHSLFMTVLADTVALDIMFQGPLLIVLPLAVCFRMFDSISGNN